MRRALLCAFVLLSGQAAFADFSGKVVHVQDGDTLTVLIDKRQVKVRLDAIDAPELKQAFGQRSKQSMLEICAGKAAQVIDQGKDRYGRTIGRVGCAGVDANGEQVRRGMACVFVKYAPANSPLYGLEARREELGAVCGWTIGPSRLGSGGRRSEEPRLAVTKRRTAPRSARRTWSACVSSMQRYSLSDVKYHADLARRRMECGKACPSS